VPEEARYRYPADFDGACTDEEPDGEAVTAARRIRLAPDGFQLQLVHQRGADPAAAHAAIVRCIGTIRGPLLVSIRCPRRWMNPAGLAADLAANDGVWGGSSAGFNGMHGRHAVVLCGYDMSRMRTKSSIRGARGGARAATSG